MDIRRFLHSFVHADSDPVVAREPRGPEFSLRPGMHQPMEEPNANFFSGTDLALLRRMGICVGTRAADNDEVDDPKICCGEGSIAQVRSLQRGFPQVKLPI